MENLGVRSMWTPWILKTSLKPSTFITNYKDELHPPVRKLGDLSLSYLVTQKMVTLEFTWLSSQITQQQGSGDNLQ